jgi:hypothetical protein
VAASFIRRFLFDPGNAVLLNIESVNILDLTPPASISGIGTGTVLVVGEFENGSYNTPTQVASATDLASTFGVLGFTYAGVPANNPCAVSRKADSAIAAEYWNGNGSVQLNGKQFASLVICRVDTSVGFVQFSPLAYITGGSSFRYTLTSGQILGLDIGAGNVSSTFTGVAAVLTSGSQTFPTGFTGGETLTFAVDQGANFTVTFLSGDTTQAATISRINAAAGFTFASVDDATHTFYTGIQKGTGGKVVVVSGTSSVLTALGLSPGTTNGTGNVANIAAVTPAEVKTIVEAAVTGTKVETDPNGAVRISNTTSPGSITVTNTTTATGLGFTVGQTATQAVSVPTTGILPAGTVVENSGKTRVFVTCQDVVFAASGVTVGGVLQTSAGPYTVKVRHAVDDGTGQSAATGTVTVVDAAPSVGSYSVTNPALINAALTEAAIDAAYTTALNATTDINTIARQVNISYSARQSNAVRRALKANALAASANGCFGRMTVVRTPLGTSKANATSTSTEPGVGAYRDQRVIFTWPQARTFVPVIAQRGVGGGTGFTADGNVDVGADGFMASILSQLAPEENPGQDTPFTGGMISLESAAPVLQMQDYIDLKAAGIAAPRMNGGTAIFQSGVTSVDPLVYPSLVRIARRRMADFIQDSLAQAMTGYGKKLSTNLRRKALVSTIRTFLNGLLNKNNPGQQRIGGFTVDPNSGNTPTTLGLGIFRVIVNVQTLPSLDSIVLQTTIGDTVQVDEVLPQAA